MIKLYYWTQINKKKQNFGDLLSKYIVENISLSKVQLIDPSSKKYKLLFKHYFAIGSILCRANKNSIVWGSGIIKKDEDIKKAKFLAVRGPKTRKRLIELGYNVPKVYGDPGILTSIFYHKEADKDSYKKYEFGIIPHYVDFDKINNKLKDIPEILVINLMTSNVEDVLDKILSCRKIISTSLHGVIVAQSFEIPAIWLKYGDSLAGDDIKFYDYYESIGINYPDSKYFDFESINSISKIFEAYFKYSLPNNKTVKNTQINLVKNCPFISNKRKKYIIKSILNKQ